ncbi:hypothetical protein ACSTK1_19870 [Vibrio parahaemolyticus]|uniref:hypothetical protein n=1 Tax=Vibrio parahaemolyticus TaxID=670 RepID=UPI00112450B0|nr:hypothetical protein [Vibrio parahaemolyticus]MBE4329690.1 hypothetical protein [Vibrio parahaemolyticus]MBE4344401.1 hypothetical protein [Vibrio parahaemolyticus]MDF4911119.1 hypothetical protein [Vibrio parahaemolyticus]TOP38824.1 hypothetical protein CGH18_09280 [Vibrio parahaemolyticus]HCE4729523.1 hypothetical protein [Vibrio parahaemolyticus]
MINNWTVTTQAVKNGTNGVVSRERYLLSRMHPNHRNTEQLISMIGSPSVSTRIALAGEQFKLRQKLNNAKGGRPLSSYAVEFCLTLPKSIRPSEEQWRAMLSDCCFNLACFLKLTPEETKQYKSQIRAVLHRQPQLGRFGAGDHVHLIIGKVVGDKVLKELQQKKGTAFIKQAFNAAVLKHLGLDHREYKPHELGRGKRLETWRYEYFKAEEAKRTQDLVVKLQKQADKWFKALGEYDFKQQKRQLSRILKTFDEISSTVLTEVQEAQISDLKSKIDTFN